MSKLNNEPRCYGFASAYGADDEICGQCDVVNTCGPLARENLNELSKLIDVGNIGSMHTISGGEKISKPVRAKQPLFDPGEIKKVKTYPMGVHVMIDKITKCCGEIHSKFLDGENPFSISDRPAYLRPIAALILSGNSSDKDIVGDLQGRFDMPAKQAENLCRIVKSALIEVGAVVEWDNKLEIRWKL